VPRAAPAGDRAGGAAGEGEEGGFGDELGGYVDAPGAEGTAQADLGASFEDGDDHDVGDAAAADSQGHDADGKQQVFKRGGGVRTCGEGVGRVGDRDVLRCGRLHGGGEHRFDRAGAVRGRRSARR
jgi:hypothetical protein